MCSFPECVRRGIERFAVEQSSPLPSSPPSSLTKHDCHEEKEDASPTRAREPRQGWKISRERRTAFPSMEGNFPTISTRQMSVAELGTGQRDKRNGRRKC